jgi:hypothetical protein
MVSIVSYTVTLPIHIRVVFASMKNDDSQGAVGGERDTFKWVVVHAVRGRPSCARFLVLDCGCKV